MDSAKFKAMVVRELDGGGFSRNIEEREFSTLPEGEVLINVKYSSLNFKDALSATGNKGVTRKYPHTPGIDAAGVIEYSASEKFSTGDEIIITGYDLGMNTSGGFGQYIRVPADWIVRLPEGLTLTESMIYGTAGFTAALSVYKLVASGVKPEEGDILVTGATGGVGSIAVSILNKLGYSVTAATGKAESKEMLIRTGAKSVISRTEIDDQSGKALLREMWAGAIDTVGGNILATAIKSTKYGGTVTTCGNVASAELSLTVYPFILRGVSLIGIDSVQCPMDLRLKIWKLLSDEWKPDDLSLNVEEVSLGDLDERIDSILRGKLTGRTIVNLDL